MNVKVGVRVKLKHWLFTPVASVMFFYESVLEWLVTLHIVHKRVSRRVK